jgi:hypothetical protein
VGVIDEDTDVAAKLEVAAFLRWGVIRLLIFMPPLFVVRAEALI